MIKMEVDSQLLENQRNALKACMAVDSEFEKRLREHIFEELKRVRFTIADNINFKNGDPRGTARAVKRYVAAKYLGGVVSIRSPKTMSGSTNNYEPPRTLRPGQRGGNRMPRSLSTHTRMHYGPQDRNFILNFLNAGTAPRYANGRNVTGNNNNRRNFFKLQEEGDWYRGSIAPRNFFGTLGEPAMKTALENIVKMIDEEWQNLLKE